MNIWTFLQLVHQIKSLYEVLILKQDLLKTLFFVIVPFCTPHSLFVLTLAYGRAVLYRSIAFSILVFSTKNGRQDFWKRFDFQKYFFPKLKYWNYSKFSVIVLWKHASLSNGGLFWKILVTFFTRTYVLSVVFKLKPLRKIFFLC